MLVQERLAMQIGDFLRGDAPLPKDGLDELVVLHLHLCQVLLPLLLLFLLLEFLLYVIRFGAGLLLPDPALPILGLERIEIEAVERALRLETVLDRLLSRQIYLQKIGMDTHVLAGHEFTLEVVIKIEQLLPLLLLLLIEDDRLTPLLAGLEFATGLLKFLL